MTNKPTPAGASRAVGAIFFTLFGAAWLSLWYSQTHVGAPLGWLVIAVEALALLGFAVRKYRRNRSAPADADTLARKRRTDRIFKWINVAQWVLIFAASEVLERFGYAAWIVPAALGIIGLHLLPLARIFRYRPHYFTSGALLALAAGYPLLTPDGPSNPIGFFGAGVILWASAAWALAT